MHFNLDCGKESERDIKMNINEVKDLMTQFDGSSLREFSWRTAEGELSFSKQNKVLATPAGSVLSEAKTSAPAPISERSTERAVETELVEEVATAEGEAVKSFGWCSLLAASTR